MTKTKQILKRHHLFCRLIITCVCEVNTTQGSASVVARFAGAHALYIGDRSVSTVSDSFLFYICMWIVQWTLSGSIFLVLCTNIYVNI